MEKLNFKYFWEIFLQLIEKIAFNKLDLIRIYTYSFDIRPKLYEALKKSKFIEENRFENKFELNSNHKVDIVINAKYSHDFKIRKVTKKDVDLIYKLNNEDEARKNSFNNNSISYKDHIKWFRGKYNSADLDFYVVIQNKPVGILRIEKKSNINLISFVVGQDFRKMKIGSKIISFITNKYWGKDLVAYVLESNLASQKIFKRFGFKVVDRLIKNDRIFVKFLRIKNIGINS